MRRAVLSLVVAVMMLSACVLIGAGVVAYTLSGLELRSETHTTITPAPVITFDDIEENRKNGSGGRIEGMGEINYV